MLKLAFNIVLMLIIASVIILGCGKSDKADETSAELITITEFKTLLDSQADVLIVDVRGKSEYDAGHIPGAIRMTYPDEIKSRYKELPTDKTIVLY